MKARSRAITTSTTTVQILDDRFAKIATVYTQGAVKVRYIADRVMTDQIETIFLPVRLKDCGDAIDVRAWGYLNHEMGHIEVQRQIQAMINSAQDNPRFAKTQNSAMLYEAIPRELRSQNVGIPPGSLAKTPVELMKACDRDVQRIVSFCRRGNARKNVDVFKAILNAVEDIRMERQVSLRWNGAKDHIAASNEASFQTWVDRCNTEEVESNYVTLSVGMLLYLHGKQDVLAKMGPKISDMVHGVKDILDDYLSVMSLDCHGFFDAWNASILLLTRILKLSEGSFEPEPPKPPETPADEPSDETPEEDPDESDESDTGDSGDSDDDSGEEPDDQESEGDDEDGSGGSEPDEDGDQDSDEGEPDGESEPSEGDEGADAPGEGEGDGDPDEGEGDDGEDDGADSAKSGDDPGVLKTIVGAKIRIKATGKLGVIRKVFADGSIEVDEID